MTQPSSPNCARATAQFAVTSVLNSSAIVPRGWQQPSQSFEIRVGLWAEKFQFPQQKIAVFPPTYSSLHQKSSSAFSIKADSSSL